MRRPIIGGAGVVNENIELAPSGKHRASNSCNLFWIREVADVGHHHSAVTSCIARREIEPFSIDVYKIEIGPVRRQRQRNGTTDS